MKQYLKMFVENFNFDLQYESNEFYIAKNKQRCLSHNAAQSGRYCEDVLFM